MKNILIILIVLFSIKSFSQSIENNDNQISFFESGKEISYEDIGIQDNQEASPNYPIDDPLPINDYLPILIIAAVGLGFFYRKEINQTIKSN